MSPSFMLQTEVDAGPKYFQEGVGFKFDNRRATISSCDQTLNISPVVKPPKLNLCQGKPRTETLLMKVC